MVAALFLILPVRAAWNYVKAPARVMRQFGLTPLGIEDHRMEVVAVAEAMGVLAPATLSSLQCRTPFVFGRNSRQVYLALPNAWSSINANSRRVMLLHELAHIRNRDVGFSTWSFAFLSDLRWTLLLSPAGIALSLWGRQEYLTQAAVLYVACLLILWFTTNAVLRNRELLADATVAMMIDSGLIVRTFEEIPLTPATGLHLGNTDSPGLILRLRNWLADKVMFSKHHAIWAALARLVEWSLETHPSRATRRSALRSRHAAGENSSVRNGEAFGAGLTLGLLGVLIALGGFWTGKYVLSWQDEEQVVLLSYDWGGTVAPLVIVFVVLFFVLPAWSCLRPQVPTGRSLAHLLTRYLYGLLGAGCILPLILLGGWSHLEIKLLFVLAVLWVLSILAVGIAANLILLSLWLSLRYKRRYFFSSLVCVLYSHSLALLAIFGYLAWSLVLMFGGQALAAGSIEFGLLIGLSVTLALSKNGVVSGTDQYEVISLGRLIIALEGRTYRRWSPLVGSTYWMGSCMIPAIVVSTILYEMGSRALRHVDTLVALVIVVLLGCTILVFFDRRWSPCMREICRQKACALIGAQILSPCDLSAESSRVINGILSEGVLKASRKPLRLSDNPG
jgi:hypothetical protein